MPAPASSDPAPDPTADAPMQVLRGFAVSPGIAIGPVAGARSRGVCGCRRARSPPRRSPPSWPGSIAGLEAAGREAEQAEAEARARLGPQYADILAAHARMIGDPTFAPMPGRGSSATGSPPSTPSSRSSRPTPSASSG